MKHKIYGVNNLKEWNALIHSGNVTMRVNFSGGANTKRGRIPATYDTSDAVKQAIIEKSQEFKTGKIYVVQSIEVPDDEETKARKNFNAQVEARRAAANTTTDTKPSANEDKKPSANEDEKKASGAVIKVADKADAVEWLKENHPDKGYTANKLRSEAAFTAACQECGVTFQFVG